LFDLQRPNLTRGWIRAVTSKPTPHLSSPPEEHETEHPSPGNPGQHHTNLTQPPSSGISNPGWYLLHHQADLALPKQRSCVYSPYSYLPRKGFAPPCLINAALSTSSGTAHPGAAQILPGWSTKPTKDKDNSTFWHQLPASPSCLAAPQRGTVLRVASSALPPGSTGQLRERRVALTC